MTKLNLEDDNVICVKLERSKIRAYFDGTLELNDLIGDDDLDNIQAYSETHGKAYLVIEVDGTA